MVKTGAGNGLVTFTLSVETEVSVGAGIAIVAVAGAAGAATVGVGSFVGAGVGAVVGAGAGAGVGPGVGSDTVWTGSTVGSLRTVDAGGNWVDVGSGDGSGASFEGGAATSDVAVTALSTAGVLTTRFPLLQPRTVNIPARTNRKIRNPFIPAISPFISAGPHKSG